MEYRLNLKTTSRSRNDYEFPDQVKQDVLNRSGGLCEECGGRKATEYHHITSVSAAILFGLEISFIASADNCSHVCHWCHELLDMTA